MLEHLRICDIGHKNNSIHDTYLEEIYFTINSKSKQIRITRQKQKSQNHVMAPISKEYPSRATQVLLQQQNIGYSRLHIPWTSKYLDLNAIVHLRDEFN